MRLLLTLFLLLAAVARTLAEAPPVKWEPVAKPWDRSLGTHRVILKTGDLPADTKAVAARIEWRRPDPAPEKKAILVYDLKTGKQITNVDVEKVTAEDGVLIFEPVSGPGEYAVYFLPVKIEGGAFPVSKYLPPQKTADDLWHRQHGTASGVTDRKFKAEVVRWEAISTQDAWTEMEVIATPEEIDSALKHQWAKGIVIHVPKKNQSLRLLDTVSRQMVSASAGQRYLVRPGEDFVFQVALWSPKQSLNDVQLSFSDFSMGGSTVRPEAIQCLTTERTDWNGVKSTGRLDLPAGEIRTLWYWVKAPKKTGWMELRIGVRDSSGERISDSYDFTIDVEAGPITAVDADPKSLSRLRWLNSTTAVDDEPVKGYTPLTVSGRTVRCLGRELELGEDGLPAQIRSYFNKAVTKVMDKPTLELLHLPTALIVDDSGDIPDITGNGLKFTKTSPAAVEWTSQLATRGLKGELHGRMEFDGSVNYRIALEATDKPVNIGRLGLRFCRKYDSLYYATGLQHEGGWPSGSEFQWKWDTANKHQDSVWQGTVNGGLRVQLKSDNYVRPGVNIHYKRRPLNDPPSWNAGGKGGIELKWADSSGFSALHCYSGPVTFEPGKPLHFDFDLLITPFHTLRTKEQWTDRYYHTGGVPQDYNKYLDGAKAAGANVVNIHQGNALNPYINYPFLTWEKLRDFSKAAHDRGIRAKYYYTVRELSNWCPEIFALRSMGDEILMSGKGGGHPWGEEHLGGNYWQAWYEPGVQDVSFLTQPMSRFHNYYIEGLRWLCENAGCDGIYLDDIAYDRSIMLRARKVLDRSCPRGGLIDLHSWNEFHEGGAWAHCANIFMDSMPFVDRLWFGEGHHYAGPPPEHFLVEISGIPFGLMGEMLEGGGNPWLGLVHGCTGRLGWGGSPQSVWKLWDDFGVQDAEFIGWWAGEECPVQCADDWVKATVWKKAGATLVAVANFSKEAKPASLTIDWSALGRDPAKTKLYFPPVAAPLKQKASLTTADKPILLKPYSGAVFILDEKPHDLAAPPASEALGAVILDEDFTRGLDKAWKPVLSPHAKDGARLDAGYVLQVPANVHAYLERPLPAEAAAVSARIWQDGKDQGQQWGPGLAVIWPDGKTLRTNIRQDGRLTVSANGGENLDASSSARAPVEFTIRWDKDTVKVIAAGPAMGDLAEEIASFPRNQFPGQPSLLRTGKMPNNTAPRDHGDPGPAGFNRIEWVRIHGPK